MLLKMTKNLTILSLFLMLCSTSFAQRKQTTIDRPNPSGSYLGLTTGINNIGGLAGLTFEGALTPTFSGKVALGVGGWGTKFAVAGKYYKQFPTSWSFGVGYSTASGARNIDLELDNQKIKMNLDRSHNLDFVIGKAWGNKIRFGLEFGYSVPVSGGTYAPVDKTVVLSTTSKRVLDLLSPSGLILGLGLGFRL
jgi:hypothetical protein